MVEPGNRRLLSERGVTVWLDVPLSIAMERLDGGGSGDRPLFRDPEGVVKLYEDRLPVYKTSDLRIEIERGTSVQEVAKSVRLILETKQCDT
jgi:shikimate kinase